MNQARRRMTPGSGNLSLPLTNPEVNTSTNGMSGTGKAKTLPTTTTTRKQQKTVSSSSSLVIPNHDIEQRQRRMKRIRRKRKQFGITSASSLSSGVIFWLIVISTFIIGQLFVGLLIRLSSTSVPVKSNENESAPDKKAVGHGGSIQKFPKKGENTQQEQHGGKLDGQMVMPKSGHSVDANIRGGGGGGEKGQQIMKQIMDGGDELHHNFRRHTDSAPPCTPMDSSDVSFTLVTQLSIDRMWMMEQHCQRWGSQDPISVAVFTDESIENVTNRIIAEGGCTLNQLTVQTLHTSPYGTDDYPVNKLRNMALSAVRTSHVMYVDVDFWEGTELHDILSMLSVREQFASNPKFVAVIPAFQIMRQCREYRDCREENIRKMPRTTMDMYNMMKDRQGSPFDPTNRAGHGSTDYRAWFGQEDGEFVDIPCVTSNRYEPYMAFRYCHDLPPFQEEFTGYGKNKMTVVMQMRRSGYIFAQLGGAFVVHYPHLDSPSRMKWNEGPKDVLPHKNSRGKWSQKHPKDVQADWIAFKRGQVDKLFVQFRNWLYTEVPDESKIGLCEDGQDDDAKLWIDRSE